MANFALNYSFSRNLDIPLDEDAVKATLAEVKDYVATKGKCYAGQLFSVTGDTGNNGLYLTISKGEAGIIVKMATQEALDAVAASAGKIDEIRVNGNTLAINDKIVNIDLSDYITITEVNTGLANAISSAKTYTDNKLKDYATKSYVTDQIVSAMTGGEIELTGYAKEEDVKDWDEGVLASAKTYTDDEIYNLQSNFNWVDTSRKVRFWRGTREAYDFLAKNNGLDSWTRYSVIDTVLGKEIVTEYFGANQITELTGQLLPVTSIIGNVTEVEMTPYSRYLVGADGSGYQIAECLPGSEGTLKWSYKDFDYRYGVRVIERGLKNYVYVNGILKTYDDVDCGSF